MDIFIAVLPVALALIMLSRGLTLTGDDLARVLREPTAFAIGVASQLVALPLVAYALTIAFALPADLAFGLMILSFCPGGVTSNMLTQIAKGDLALSVSLSGVVSLVSVLTLPLFVALSARHFLGFDAPEIDAPLLGFVMVAMTAVPVALGMALRRWAPGLTGAIEGPLAKAATALFVVIVIGAIASNWALLLANIDALAPALIVFNIVMLAVGVGLSRAFSLSPGQATAIAIEAGIQNATLGITVGTLIVERASDLPPFSLPSGVYAVTMYLVSLPFVFWRRWGRAEGAASIRTGA